MYESSKKQLRGVRRSLFWLADDVAEKPVQHVACGDVFGSAPQFFRPKLPALVQKLHCRM